MLKTKSCKIILGVLATLAFMMAIFFATNVFTVKAEEVTLDYVTLSKATLNTEVDDSLEFAVEDGASVTFNNALVLNDLAFSVKTQNVTKVTVTFKTASYDVNGETVEHKVELPIGQALVVDGVASSSSVSNDFVLYFDVDGFKVGAGIDGTTFTYGSDEYKSENIDKCIASDIKFTVTASANAKINFVYADQNYNDADSKYKQFFVQADGDVAKKSARLSLNNTKNLFVLGDNGYEMQTILGAQYTLTIDAYSVLGNDVNSTYQIDKEALADDVWTTNETYTKTLVFKGTGAKAVTVKSSASTSSEVFNFNVVDTAGVDTTAPIYVNDQKAIDSFKAKLLEATKMEEGGQTYNIRLGENLEIPSLKNLVKEDYTAYSDLTYKVYYNTPSASGKTATTMKIPVDEAGEYSFYVIFTDKEGNALEKDDFIVDPDDNTTGTYKDFIFSFEIEDNAPISIISIAQDNGYVGTLYNASDFTVKYSGYTLSYELYYNPVVEAVAGELKAEDGWIKIPVSSSVTEDDEFEDGLDYDKVKDIAYNGSLSFKPDAIGKYVIKCTATSQKSVRSAEAISEIVVEKEQTVVKPASDWLENNVWSVVFLGVGTLCLIGIVILLCIKPKERED